MKVTCNRAGGFDFHGIRLRKGDSEIDDAKWNAAVARLPKGWLEELVKKSLLVIHGETPAPAAKPAPPAAEPEPPAVPAAAPLMSAKEKIAEAKAATTHAELDALEDGETRATVLKAIFERAAELDEGARG